MVTYENAGLGYRSVRGFIFGAYGCMNHTKFILSSSQTWGTGAANTAVIAVKQLYSGSRTTASAEFLVSAHVHTYCMTPFRIISLH